MIIQSVDGRALRLTKTRLTLLEGGGPPFFINLKELQRKRVLSDKDAATQLGPDNLRKNRKTRWAQLYDTARPKDKKYIIVSADNNKIGCCEFDDATFARILKAAGIRPKKNAR
jgi:hypothetical protein